MKASAFLGFPCLPAFTTLGVVVAAFPAPESAAGDARGEHGGVALEPEADLGEEGEEEEAESEERFLRPTGTGLGAEACGEEDSLESALAPLAFGWEAAGAAAAGTAGVAKENKGLEFFYFFKFF